MVLIVYSIQFEVMLAQYSINIGYHSHGIVPSKVFVLMYEEYCSIYKSEL